MPNVTRISLNAVPDYTEDELYERLFMDDINIDEVEIVLDNLKIPIRREGPRIMNPKTGETIYQPPNDSRRTYGLKAFVNGYLYARRRAE